MLSLFLRPAWSSPCCSTPIITSMFSVSLLIRLSAFLRLTCNTDWSVVRMVASDWSVVTMEASDGSVFRMQASDWSVVTMEAYDWSRGCV